LHIDVVSGSDSRVVIGRRHSSKACAVAWEVVATNQVFNATNSEVYSWDHTVPASVNITESWTPTAVGDYSINATSWLTIPGNEVMMKGLEASKLIHVQDTEQSAATGPFTLVAIAIVAVAAGYLTLRHKRGGSKPSPV
jgi:hypothetical protein